MPKIYAACGAVGFVLSFVVGIFSGASFLLVLLKVLIFGVVFAGLAVLLSFLQKRFMPDLFDTNAVVVPLSKARASKLDVTISDDKDAPPKEDTSFVPDFMKNRSRGKSDASSASGAKRKDEPGAADPASESAQSAPVDEAKDAEDAPSADKSLPPADELSDAMPDADSFASSDKEYESDEDEEEYEPEEEDDEEEDAPLDSLPLERGAAKNEPLSIDANVDVMAKAIRTVLAKEK